MENINEKPIEDNEEIEEVVESIVEDDEPMEKPKTGRHKRTPAQLESLKKAQQTRRENIAKRKKELEEIGKTTLKQQTKTKPIDIPKPKHYDSDDEPVIVKKKKSRKPKIVLEESSDDDNEIVISRRRRKSTNSIDDSRRKPANKQEVNLDAEIEEVRKQQKELEEEEDEQVEKPKPKPKPKNETKNVVPPEQYYSNRDILRAYGL